MSEETETYAIEVWNSFEQTAIDLLTEKSKLMNLGVKNIFQIEGLRGYIFAKAKDKRNVDELIKGMKYVRQRVKEPVNYDEVVKFIEDRHVEPDLVDGTVVEVVAGPFKGMQALVLDVNPKKEEVKIQLIDSAFEMSLTVHENYVRKDVKPRQDGAR